MPPDEKAKPDDKSKKEVRFVPNPELWSYLGWLSRNTLLGETEGDVARQILTQKLSEMRREEYQDPPKRT